MGFPILPFFLLFQVLLAIRLNYLKAKRQQQEDEFWAKEREAKITPAKDISNLRYITIPIEKFPLNFSNDEKVIEIETQLKELSTHKLLNLSGVSNTDLKLTYGTSNFETMSQIGEDFDKACILLNSYAKALVEAGMENDAVNVLEFAIGIGTDISESYIMLSDCYKKRSQTEKLSFLRERILNSNLLLKNSILNKIDDSTEEDFSTSSQE